MLHAKRLAIAVLLAVLVGCTASSGLGGNGAPAAVGDNSRNALDWAGVYTGTVPCADCAGIRTRIELRDDGSFSRSLVYLGEDEQPFTDTGRFEWDDTGSRITLPAGGRDTQQYLVGENALFHLDSDGQRITGDLAAAYRLEKRLTGP